MSPGTLTWLRLYLEVNALLALAAGALLLALGLATGGGRRFAARHWLRASQAIFLAALLLPPAVALLPPGFLLPPMMELWQGRQRSAQERYVLVAAAEVPRGFVTAPPPEAGWKLRPDGALLLLAVALLGATVAAARLRGDWRRLRRHVDALPAWKARGRVRLLACDDTAVPFSTRCGREALVVVPTRLLAEPGDLRLAVAHELQHHRQGDTRWTRLFAILTVPGFWNPALVVWGRIFDRLQEFACDEALLGRRGFPAQAYGGCLLRAAERAVARRRLPVGTAGIVAAGRGALLERRLKMILGKTRGPARAWLPAACSIGLVAFLATAAFASRSAVQDRALGLEDATELLSGPRGGAEIPVTVNDQVLPWLNRFLATPEGKAWFRDAVARMAQYRPMIERKLRERKLPRELLAVPLIESGYRNTQVEGSVGAGLWGFTVGTARRYGLVIEGGGAPEGKYDERLDEERATEAALRLLSDLQGHFQDWRLALDGYNKGQSFMDELIDAHGTRDPWALERRPEVKEKYLSTFTAALALLKYGELL